jgi:hypothetical protein
MSLAVENSLEDWMGLYNSVMKVSLLPYPPLERELPQLRLRCDARDDYLMLLPRRMKMVSAGLSLLPLNFQAESTHLTPAAGSSQAVCPAHVHRTSSRASCAGA